MFETFTILTLQQYWWIIISILASLLVFLMFVQGGQTLIYTLGKTETERTLIVNTLGRKWELTFTTLVTFGGRIFCLFPFVLFYQFRGCLLGLDGHIVCIHYSGHFL
jgi:cytochrome d ubiquinol oxidase subunit II